VSSAPEQRLARLGLTLPEAPAPLAAYVAAVRDGDHVWTSGQLPLVEGKPMATGLVGDHGFDKVSPEQAAACARVCALNALAAVRGVVGDLANVTQVIKVVVYVASAPGFTGQPAVANGASELFGEVFGDLGRHARSAVGVLSLPLGAPVELDLVVRAV